MTKKPFVVASLIVGVMKKGFSTALLTASEAEKVGFVAIKPSLITKKPFSVAFLCLRRELESCLCERETFVCDQEAFVQNAANTLCDKAGVAFLVVSVQCSYTVRVNQLRFEWDTRKAAANLRQHEISFEEAKSIFLDEEALVTRDEDHSTEEDRFVIMGFSMHLRILVVCHCYRQSGDVIRIISARKASRTERNQYERRRTT